MWIQYSTMEWKEMLLMGPYVTHGTHQKVGVWGKVWGVILGCDTLLFIFNSKLILFIQNKIF